MCLLQDSCVEEYETNRGESAVGPAGRLENSACAFFGFFLLAYVQETIGK